MKIKKFLLAVFLFSLPQSLSAQEIIDRCFSNEEVVNTILEHVKDKDPNALKALPTCFKLDRKLILQAVLIDPSTFQYAEEILHGDESFVKRLLKISPDILQYASPRLRADRNFMEHATYLSRNALQYADPKILNDRLFMKRMIEIDSKNYMLASARLRSIPEFAQMAFSDNGMLLSFAPEKIKADKKLVKIAVISNVSALAFASDALKKDKELLKIASKKTTIDKDNLAKFIRENYLVKEKKKNLGLILGNQAKFFAKNKIINRNYVTKWQRHLNFHNGHVDEETRLMTADSRNYPILWKQDFRRYPDLVKKIEKFFFNRQLDNVTVENLSTTFLWKIKEKPLTLAFNLYLLRDSTDFDLGPDFVDVTSLTVIAQKQKNKWHLTVVEVIFDNETKVEVAYENGHKKYVLWDLYKNDKFDQNPKIIFKVEDRLNEYFEIFEEQHGGKYQMIYRVDGITPPKAAPVRGN